jgi:hypothetical protein
MAPPLMNLKGHRYGQLKVLRVDKERSSPGHRFWLCRCLAKVGTKRCGNVLSVSVGNLRGKHRQKFDMKCKSCASRVTMKGSWRNGKLKSRPRLPSRLTEEDREGYRTRMVTSGELGKKYGVSDSLVRRWMKAAGVRRPANLVVGIEVERVVELAGKSVDEVSVRLNVGRGYARLILKGMGGESKWHSERRLERMRKVWEAVAAGESEGRVARRIGVTRQRVEQMLAWWLGRKAKEAMLERTRLEETP